MTNEVITTILSRQSVRKYKPQQVTDDELLTVLEAGTYAPTSRGLQSPYIVAVQNEAICTELRRMNAEIMGVTSDPYYAAPTIVLVFVPVDFANGSYDAACVLENMMIAAQAIGLGTCWIHREQEMFDTPRGKELMKAWGLPDGLRGVGALAIGYPDGEMPTRKPRKENYFRIVK